MPNTIQDAYSQGYHYAVSLNLQQKGSKLAGTVRNETQNVARYFYDRISPVEAVDVTTSRGDTPILATTFDRRAVTLTTSDWGDLIDNQDKIKMLADPTSAFALNAAYALGRKKDQRIIEAAMGSAAAGTNGEIAVPLPSSQVISATYTYSGLGTGEIGLTLDKLRMARQMLNEADVDEDEPQYCVLTARQITDLLRTVEVSSNDYNSVKALVDGHINSFLGFTFKRVSSSLLKSLTGGTESSPSTLRQVLVYSESALLLATASDIKTDIVQRPDKRMATQVYASLSCGATRLDEKKVVVINCKE